MTVLTSLAARSGLESLVPLTIPVDDVSYDDGVSLSSALVISVSTDTEIVTNTTSNLIADLPGVNPSNVAMAGAHPVSTLAGVSSTQLDEFQPSEPFACRLRRVEGGIGGSN